MQEKIKYLKDYCEPNYWAEFIDITFDIQNNGEVTVTSIVNYYKNDTQSINALTLSGSAEIIEIKLNNNILMVDEYLLKNDELTITNLPDRFVLEVKTKLQPYINKTCMGLYGSNGTLFTQNEPEGFRKITYYLDRPDVMAIYTTHIIADNNKYPILLSNGNKISEKQLPENKKMVTWYDPFKKPSYLFALVAGDLSFISDNYTTKSGKNVRLEIYSKDYDLHKCEHAMQSLKNSMKWDEERFNLEYDLDIYMIVAANDFNMGAMENKGLNIFNTKYVFATPQTATDNDFINVEAVIGHEYFHNWTGNRVTCKNWFQLSLKEGLTVFRDQEFTADLHGHSINRIKNVKALRQSQFTEDEGPLAHPVRPNEYIEMNNFYTMTVYEKGAEVVRMYQSILGREGFNKGLELYFKRHDGFAVTCDDFCRVMSDANNINLEQFMLWYSQAGTPHVTVSGEYNQSDNLYVLSFRQNIPDTPNQSNKKPMLIPIKIGLIDNLGHEQTNIQVKSEDGKFISHNDGIVLLLDKEINTFYFTNVKTKPIPSLLREFSAPIKLYYNYTEDERYLLVSYDSDEFNRWEHLQQILIKQIKAIYKHFIANKEPIIIDKRLFNSLRHILSNINLDAGFRAFIFEIPSFQEMLSEIKDANPEYLQKSIDYLSFKIGEELFDTWLEIYNLNLSKPYNFIDHGKRSLKNRALSYIIKTLQLKIDNPASMQFIETIALGQYDNSDNMTDSFAVIAAISNLNAPLRDQILEKFYKKWNKDELVMDKWFAVQALSQSITVDKLNKLMVDSAFIATNPNKIYALLKSFINNGGKFNSQDGYTFIVDKIIVIDKFNPSVASNLCKGFGHIVNLEQNYRKMAKNALSLILHQPIISDELSEVLNKTIFGLSI